MKFQKWQVASAVFATVVILVASTYSNKKSSYLDYLVPITKTDLVDSGEIDKSFFVSQDFNFLGYGRQSVAFESSDQRYVLKFFTKEPFQINLDKKNRKFSLRSFVSKWIINLRFALNIKSVLRNYSKLFTEKPEIAGLVAVHLNDTKKLPCLISLHWPNNTETVCDLNQYPFVIQKKAELVCKTLEKASSKQEKLKLLDKLKNFLIRRANFGFMDKKKAMGIGRNFGFLDGEPVQFDVGSVVFNPKLLDSSKEEIEQVLELFDLWVSQNRERLNLN